MRTRGWLLVGLLLTTVFVGTQSVADELIIHTLPAAPKPGEAMFVNGLSDAQVLARFGEPQQRLPAVGQPPISRWVYADFTVYFEYDRALHAVRHRGLPPALRD